MSLTGSPSRSPKKGGRVPVIQPGSGSEAEQEQDEASSSKKAKGKQRAVDDEEDAADDGNGNGAEEGQEDDEDEEDVDEETMGIWEAFTDEWHDIIVELPLEFERNFKLLTELEEQQQTETNQLKAALNEHIRLLTTTALLSAPSPSASLHSDSAAGDSSSLPPAFRESLLRIASALEAARKPGDDKLHYSTMMYETIDRQIQKLDPAIVKEEEATVLGLRAGTMPSHEAPSLARKDPPGRTTNRGAIALGEMDAYDFSGLGQEQKKSKDKKGKRKASAQEEDEDGQQQLPVLPASDDLFGVINPHEPRYCFCHNISHGQMVGCDNEDCQYEWFHWGCVGLTSPPEGDWYCAACKEEGFGAAEKEKSRDRNRDRDRKKKRRR